MKQRGFLLDRDGVVNVDHGYVGRREDFAFMPDLFPFLRKIQDAGYRLAILTNQSGVARGLYTADDYESLTVWMREALAAEGITMDLVLACFEHPDAVIPAYGRESFWRKPNAGMVLEAIQRLDLDPARSVFLGDQMRDMQAAQAGGVGTCLLLENAPADASIALPAGITRVRSYADVVAQLAIG